MDDLYAVLQRGRLVECSHILHSGIPTWPGDIAFYRCAAATHAVSGYFKEFFVLSEGFGTHMDTPMHFFEGKRSVTDIEPRELIARGVIVNVCEQCSNNPDYELQVSDIERWEATHGRIPEGALVCMRTGWDLKFSNPEAYRNEDKSDPSHPMHFPGFSAEVADFLCTQRSIVGIGIDTLSLDPGMSATFPVHKKILGSDKYQLENMKLDELPESGAVLVVLPLRMLKAAEAPTRVLGVV